MKDNCRILYLYAEVMNYTEATLEALSENNIDTYVIHWDKNKKTPYLPKLKSVKKVYPRSMLSAINICKLLLILSPKIVVVSGWMDKGYLLACLIQRLRGGTVVTCFDDQWHGTLRQILASLLGKFGVFKLFFSHAWVSGYPQVIYAKNFGFDRDRIIYDLYSARISAFSKAYYNRNNNYKEQRFLFVGRFVEEKGINVLLKAWVQVKKEFPGARLTLVGGQLEKHLLIDGIRVFPFLREDELIHEAQEASCFILPSIFEPWGVVVHEFAAAGLPLILTNLVGAKSHFLINNYNGYCVKSADVEDLFGAIKKVILMNQKQLGEFGSRSHMLSQKITPETSAANLISLL